MPRYGTMTRSMDRRQKCVSVRQAGRGTRGKAARRMARPSAVPASYTGKDLLPDLEVRHAAGGIRVRDGDPVELWSGRSIYDRWRLEGGACKGNLFNMLVRWSTHPCFEDMPRALAKAASMDRYSEYCVREIMFFGSSLYEITGGNARWLEGPLTYEDFADSEQAASLRFEIRRQVSKIKTAASAKRRIDAARDVAERAVTAWMEADR